MLSSTTPTIGAAAVFARRSIVALVARVGHRPPSRGSGGSPAESPIATRVATRGANRLLSRYSYLRSSVTETSALKYCRNMGSSTGVTGSKNASACVSEISRSWSAVP